MLISFVYFMKWTELIYDMDNPSDKASYHKELQISGKIHIPPTKKNYCPLVPRNVTSKKNQFETI